MCQCECAGSNRRIVYTGVLSGVLFILYGSPTSNVTPWFQTSAQTPTGELNIDYTLFHFVETNCQDCPWTHYDDWCGDAPERGGYCGKVFPVGMILGTITNAFVLVASIFACLQGCFCNALSVWPRCCAITSTGLLKVGFVTSFVWLMLLTAAKGDLEELVPEGTQVSYAFGYYMCLFCMIWLAAVIVLAACGTKYLKLELPGTTADYKAAPTGAPEVLGTPAGGDPYHAVIGQPVIVIREAKRDAPRDRPPVMSEGA